MAIPGSGALSLSAIQTEYGGSNPISLSEYYRGGSLVPTSSSTAGIASSGAITMSSFYGTSNRVQITLTISSNINNYNIFSNKSGAYVAGISDITLVNNALISSPTTTAAALDTGSGWTSGDTITIDNNSSITGAGGPGGTGASMSRATVSSAATAGGAAGHGIQIQFATTIDNAGGTISGGGGGGGGGAGNFGSANFKSGTIEGNGGGGGGGGGQGGLGSGQNGGLSGPGGSASAATNLSVNGSAGAAGSLNAAGAGGAGGNFSTGTLTGAASPGGAGGTVGAAGSSGQGSYGSGPGAGGAAGNAIKLNGNSVTFTNTGTRNGATS